MIENSILRNTALSTSLHTIPVSSLKLGMVIHAIAEQAGKLGVKSKGEVKHLSVIKQLTASGVRSVVVECSMPINSRTLTGAQEDKSDSLIRPKKEIGLSHSLAGLETSDSKVEFDNAIAVLKRSATIYKNFTSAVEKNLSIDFSKTKKLVENVYDSLAKNPDALLCMSMITYCSDYIANHSIHVATLMCYFAQQMNWPKSECEKLALIGYLYDVGMVKVPESLRNKSAALSEHDKEEINQHVLHSLKIVAPLKLDNEYLLAIEQHHERLNGSGYPNGYFGLKIHKFSRMLAIVDCYDALTTSRDHKAPLAPAAAMKVLSDPNLGYDQKLVIKFIRCMGVYPVGSLVVLSNKRLALVIKANKDAPIAPVVKVFYSISAKHFISPIVIDLAELVSTSAQQRQMGDKTDVHKDAGLKVIKPALASQFGLNMADVI